VEKFRFSTTRNNYRPLYDRFQRGIYLNFIRNSTASFAGFPAIAEFRLEVTNFHASQLRCSTSRGTGCSVKSWASDKIHDGGWIERNIGASISFSSRKSAVCEKSVRNVRQKARFHSSRWNMKLCESSRTLASDDVARIRRFSRVRFIFAGSSWTTRKNYRSKSAKVNFNMRTWRFPAFNFACSRDTFKSN